MFRSLRFRLPLFFLAGIALAGLIATAVALRLFQDYAREQSLLELRREATGLSELLVQQAGAQAQPFAPDLLEQATGDRIYLVGVDPDLLFPGEAEEGRPPQ